MILLPTTTISTAVSTGLGDTVPIPPDVTHMQLQAVFNYGAGGTTAKFWIQTSLDDTNWQDIANFAFTTSADQKYAGIKADVAVATASFTSKALADNQIIDGFIGQSLRVAYTTTGTYSGATNIQILGRLKRQTEKNVNPLRR